jgi:hypothetical protein
MKAVSHRFGDRNALSQLVDLVVIGVQKAGTTALFDYLAEHPGFSLSRVKETHFFDDETQDWAAPDYGAYHRHFDPVASGVRAEATPIYVYWPHALERLKAYNPAARLVLMLRDPVDRAWSHWRMETARGAETQPFGWCIRQGRHRLFESEPWGVHREFSYVERGFYGDQVERLFGLFPREQTLILDAERLRADPNGVLREVSAFAGAAPPPQVANREVHVGSELGALDPADAEFLREIYRRDAERLADLAGVRF